MEKKKRVNLTMEEIFAKVDNLMKITKSITAIRDAVRAAREAGSEEGSEISLEEALNIQGKANDLVDEAQKFADEIVEDLLD